MNPNKVIITPENGKFRVTWNPPENSLIQFLNKVDAIVEDEITANKLKDKIESFSKHVAQISTGLGKIKAKHPKGKYDI